MEEHKRRIRYKGKYPKAYKEKYKELNPDKYQETIEKVIEKGNTPVGMHIPIMVKEIMDFLMIKENQIGLDATLGYGGHTQVMLKELNHTGHLYSLDIDPIEIVKTTKRLNDLGYTNDDITTLNINFKDIETSILDNNKCDFLLADLGVSSMQVDNPERGFSYKKEGPLDLRLNPFIGSPANELIMSLDKYELENIFVENADEVYAKEIARKICEKKSYGVINTTTMLYNIIKEALAFLPKENRDVMIKKSAQRVFQALRIEVNQEFTALEIFLTKLPTIMKSGGRIAVLTFHSGEDRRVKKAFKTYFKEGLFSYINDDVIKPTSEECYKNPRATSTKLRVAIMK